MMRSLAFAPMVAGVGMVLCGPSAMGQPEAFETPRMAQLPETPYTIRQGDFRLLISPSLGIDWNDNINTSRSDPRDDFILRPLLRLTASYPLTQKNLLRLNVGVGYDHYFEHSELSTWRLTSDSALSFDMMIKDVLINLHNRVSYTRDSAERGEVAGTAEQGTLNNTTGIGLQWNLGDVVLGGGYDRQYAFSLADSLKYQNRATDILSVRAGLQVHPQLQVGVESPLTFTSYDQPVLNDNMGYGGGVYADWRPGTVISLQPRFGYSAYDFRQTSQFLPARDVEAFYGSLTLTHQPRDPIQYSLSAGHELRLGLQTDSIEASYVRLSVNWALRRRFSVRPAFFYEHGKSDGQVLSSRVGSETYDWYGPDITFSADLTEKLRLSLNYRLTLRDSSEPSREYAQNRVGLLASYTFR